MPGRSAGKGACEFLHSKFINALVITMNALRNACVKMNAKFIRPGESMAEIIEISRLALHDQVAARLRTWLVEGRSEEHTSELQSPCNIVCRLLPEKKKTHD